MFFHGRAEGKPEGKITMDLQKPALVTGAAGFIGFHLSLSMLQAGWNVAGLDNINDYYDVRLKKERLSILAKFPGFTFHQLDLSDNSSIEDIFKQYSFDLVVHMAAQAGVRYSLINPRAYIKSNIDGFLNVLEGCRQTAVKHLVYASSSSVYGGNEKTPFSIHDNVDHPVSLYAATKKSNELMAHAYAHLYAIPCTGLRFFTVYGPWGRPDMAPFLFTRAILAGEPIRIFNNGSMVRDFTYIDDAVAAVMTIIARPPEPNPQWSRLDPDPGSSYARFKLYNIGNNKPVPLLEFVSAIEDCLGIKALKEFLPMQPGDVRATFADIEETARDFDFHPKTPIARGVSLFIDWYKRYHGL